MIQSTGWLGSIREKMRVAGDIAGAFVSGLGTGAKAVVNGLATAARSTVTLGLNTDQLELIGVSKEDRERGYDTAVTISTGSGQVLIAVGTGGMASALAKGGTVARAASGALVAYDSAGNAVGVVQGVYDATQNGVTLANGAQVAAGALGISANVKAAKGLVKARPAVTPPTTTQSSSAPPKGSAAVEPGKADEAPVPQPAKVDEPVRGGRYGHLEDPPSANSGKDFTRSQAKTILGENKRLNGGQLRDDQTGELLVPPQQRKRGVPAPPNEAQVDHVYPKSKGGPNTYSNAEVRSRSNNLRMGNKLE